jgi:hypothetical protein
LGFILLGNISLAATARGTISKPASVWYNECAILRVDFQPRRATPFIYATLHLITEAWTTIDDDPEPVFPLECVRKNWQTVVDAIRPSVVSPHLESVEVSLKQPTEQELLELGLIGAVKSLERIRS